MNLFRACWYIALEDLLHSFFSRLSLTLHQPYSTLHPFKFQYLTLLLLDHTVFHAYDTQPITFFFFPRYLSCYSLIRCFFQINFSQDKIYFLSIGTKITLSRHLQYAQMFCLSNLLLFLFLFFVKNYFSFHKIYLFYA